jgi:hypothetical protein
MPSFTKKQIRVTITLSQGKFGTSDKNILVIEGLRVLTQIQLAGAPMMGRASVHIYGMRQSDMNAMTTIRWQPFAFPQGNTILVEAGDDRGMTSVYYGDILNAWGNYSQSPDVFMEIEAQTMAYGRYAPHEPTSYSSPFDVAQALKKLALSMGLAFEDNGVNAKLPSDYYDGTGYDQAMKIGKAADIEVLIEGSAGEHVMYISPKGKPKKGIIPLISKNTGLIGYPNFSPVGIIFSTLFNPAIKLFGAVEIDPGIPTPKSELLINTGTECKVQIGIWFVYKIVYVLESEIPRGSWFMHCETISAGGAV